MKDKTLSDKGRECKCRGNLNANNPELPCSSCGGVNPAKQEAPTKQGWEKQIQIAFGNGQQENETISGYLGDLIFQIRSLLRSKDQDVGDFESNDNWVNCPNCGEHRVGLSPKKVKTLIDQEADKRVSEVLDMVENEVIGKIRSGPRYWARVRLKRLRNRLSSK